MVELDPGEAASLDVLDVDDLDDDHLVIDLPPLPGGKAVAADTGESRTKQQARRALRDQNTEYAKAIVHRTGWSPAKVNAELNRMSGVERVADATFEQLERRLALAERWLRS